MYVHGVCPPSSHPPALIYRGKRRHHLSLKFNSTRAYGNTNRHIIDIINCRSMVSANPYIISSSESVTIG